ncbi:alpha-taxilin [Engraulis encrasicolus]|uniref:alpha-taxilin n=1 Tax=Engraulis encrasicolus TaxID=184585 RepID=UPI002FD36F1F
MENTVEHQNGSDHEEGDPMEGFNQQLEDIVKTYGIAAALMEEQISNLEKQEQEEPGGDQDVAGPGSASGNGTAQLMKSLEKVKSPDQKVKILLEKYAELLKRQQSEQKKNSFLEKKSESLKMQKDNLHLELSKALLARSKLEELCKDLQGYNKTLRGEFVQKFNDDESKRKEVTTHFQTTLVDIQAQIDEYSVRNLKLCKENSDLAEKLNNIIHQYEKREESLEKIFKHHDVQQKLAEAKLEQANILLKEAEVNHKKEKEYLLKEAIEKTKKCYAMKEQELSMKKQLVLYSQKFEEFQSTLGKSNDIYVTFKEEMDKMRGKMKKLEKESDFWRDRFENCNKSLMELINERTEKAKEFEIFVLKVDKLETLCRALQQERKGLYDKIKGIRYEMFHPDVQQATTMKEEEVPEGGLEKIGVLGVTTEMAKLKAEQLRLQELAASITASVEKKNQPGGSDEEEEKDKGEDSAADNSNKMSPAPELVQEAQKSEPCKPELAKEPIKAETQVLEQPKVADIAEVVKTQPEVLPVQLVSSSEAKTEGQVQDHVKTEAVVPTETAPVVISSGEGNANQQQEHSASAQASTAAPPPVGAESTKAEVSVPKAEEKPQPAPQEKPQPAPQEKPQPAPQEKPQPAPQEKPQPAPQEKPQPAPQEKPQPAPQEKPQPAPQEKPQPAPQEKPQPAPQEKPQPAPQEKPAAEGPAKAEVVSQAKPQATQAKPQTPNAEAQASNGKPKGKKGKKKGKK